MKISHCVLLLVYAASPGFNILYAQENAQPCKVELESLVGTYTGECKNGLAHGKGDAKGADHYAGLFKKGLPDGKGDYYYGDSMYYSGNFQEGIKEGKGEMHYLQSGKPDSLIKGYWSGDEYRGKQYITYSFDGAAKFDLYEINPSPQSGNMLTIEIATTTGSPDGTKGNFSGSSGFVLTLTNLISTDGNMIKKMSEFSSPNKFSTTYEISEFPVRLFATLSNGQTFSLELYKSATWRVRLYVNK